MTRSSVDAHRVRGEATNACSGDACTRSNCQNDKTEAQVHFKAGCGAVRTDVRMRGLYSSRRRSKESGEATLRRMHGRTSSCSATKTHWCSSAHSGRVVEATGDERRDPEKWSDQARSRGEAEKHLVTKAHESPREQERKLRGVVEETLQFGSEGPVRTAPGCRNETMSEKICRITYRLTTRGAKCEVVDNISMMCRMSRRLWNKLSDQRMQQTLT